jgi:hypothetical protein
MDVNTDGTCMHCSNWVTSSGCSTCNSSRTFCSCGDLLRCGCGLTFKHAQCPNIFEIATIVHDTSILPSEPIGLVIPWKKISSL